MGFVEHDRPVSRLEPLDLFGEGGVIGREVAGAPLRDLGGVRGGARLVQRLTVEGGQRAKLGGRLAGIEGDAVRVAVHVDDGA